MTPAPSGIAPGAADGPRHVVAPVRLERLTKRYDDVVAVDDISLDIAAGEFVSLLGPSGSGKTTTLMMVAGFQDVTAGAITVGDREISRLPPHQRDIGVVFQHYALFPHMRVAENVGFPLRMRDVSKAESRRRVEEAMRLVQLESVRRPLPPPAERRPAAARRPGPGGRLRAGPGADGRAARRARPAAARADAVRDQAAAEHARHHGHLRHPRPGGGAGDVGPDRRDEPAAGSSSSPHPTSSTTARRRRSWRRSSASPTRSPAA